MEKMVYLLWKPAGAGWPQALQTLLPALRATGASRFRLNLVDEGVAAAATLRQASAGLPLPDALLSFWLDSASRQQQAIESILQPFAERLAGYSVCESEPLPNTRHVAAEGERTPGMNHVVFLQIPPRLDRQQWLDLWLGKHTAVAIDTQQTFGYRQNIVVRRLNTDAPPIDAIVEENFPPEAMTDQNAFYRQDSPQQLAENQKRMYQSCKQFIDFDRMARLPTSEYNLN